MTFICALLTKIERERERENKKEAGSQSVMVFAFQQHSIQRWSLVIAEQNSFQLHRQNELSWRNTKS